MYPRIYLAIDNCFASKRWTAPLEWMSVIKDMGLYHVEASADNECDPLYSTSEYLEDWVGEIKKGTEKTGVQVANLYSGHGTYSTLGLAHPDKRIREHIRDNWLKAMIDIAGGLNAGLGFFCHAFNQKILNNAGLFEEAKGELIRNLADLAHYAATRNVKYIGVEQMYTPHQIPWTIEGAIELLKRVNDISGKPFYLTIDVGHQSGQCKYLKPGKDNLVELIEDHSRDPEIPSGFWAGTPEAHALIKAAMKSTDISRREIQINIILEMVEKHHYLFASQKDCDPYEWLRKLGCYSPIIHLQQTDGYSSGHKPFTAEYNEKGIIDGEKVLQSIKESYESNTIDGIAPKCKELYLTIEVFSATADSPGMILKRLDESVRYWRRFIPVDGMLLNELSL